MNHTDDHFTDAQLARQKAWTEGTDTATCLADAQVAATLAQVEATDRLFVAIERQTDVIKDFLDYARAEDEAAVAALEKARAVV